MHLTNNTQNFANEFEMRMIIILSKKHFCLWKDRPEHLFGIVGSSNHVFAAFRAHLLSICLSFFVIIVLLFVFAALWANMLCGQIWMGWILKRRLHLNLRSAAATHEVTIDAVEDLLWRRHFFKTHLNPKMKNRMIFLFDKSIKIWNRRTLGRIDPGSPLSQLKVPHGLLRNC